MIRPTKSIWATLNKHGHQVRSWELLCEYITGMEKKAFCGRVEQAMSR